jgi:hypothetical protein
MRVTFELPVVVKSRIGRASVKRTVIATVPHSVDIAEVAWSEAPPALEYRQYAHSRESVAYRGYGGMLWTDCGYDVSAAREDRYLVRRFEACRSPFFGGRKGIDTRVKDALELAAKSKHRPAQTLFPDSAVSYVADRRDSCGLEPLASMRLPDGLDAQVEPQIADFDRRVEEFIIIGGVLHRREPEPLIRLFPDGRFISARIERRGHASTPIRTTGHVPRSVGWFRIDDHRSMLEEARAILSRTGGDPLADRIEHIKVHDGSLISSMPESIGVYDVADALRRHFHETMSSDGAGELPGSSLMRWMAKSSSRDIRYFKALTGRLRGEAIRDELPADLEEAFMAIAESEPSEFKNYTGDGVLRVFVEEVARRWRDRPMTLGIGLGSGRLA